jgi:hypothetical protein
MDGKGRSIWQERELLPKEFLDKKTRKKQNSKIGVLLKI